MRGTKLNPAAYGQISRAARYLPSGAYRMVGRASPYIGAAFAAYDAYDTGRKLYNSIKPASKPKGRPKGSKNKPPSYTSPSGRKSRTKSKSITTTSSIKRFKTPKGKRKYNLTYNMKGSVKVNEFGGTLSASATQAIYLGHGIASNEILRSVFRAIIKEVMRQRKTDIQNWNDYIEFGNLSATDAGSLQLSFDLSYIDLPAQNNTISTMNYRPTNNITYAQLADEFLNYWKDLSGSSSAQPKEWLTLNVTMAARNPNDNNVSYIPLATIHLKKCKFDIDFKSVLKVQNRTLSEASFVGEGASERDDITNIDNVPLQGKLYRMAKKWGNYIDVQLRPGTVQGAVDMAFTKRLTAQSETGIVQFESSTNDPAHLKKPPKGYYLGFKNEVNVICMPAQIRTDKLSFKTSISLDKLLIKFQYILNNSSTFPNQSARVEFGQMSLLGLEKMLDANRSSGSDINLAYQITQTYKCALNYIKNTPSATIINNTDTPVSYSTDKPT